VVTAGLIGGRVGNKGAVGISLKIANTTMLFVNAHLTGSSILSLQHLPFSDTKLNAAHENKVHHRLANLAKIKVRLHITLASLNYR
jgi:hypothetical protein